MEVVIEELGLLQTQYDTPEPTTTTLSADADDWIVYDASQDIYDLGSVFFPSAGIAIGDNEDNVYTRGLFSFDISDIIGTVSTATLSLYQGDTDGTPYADLGVLILDHVNFGDSIEANESNFSGNTETASVDSTTDSSNGWKEFDVADCVQADIDAGRTTSQFRVKFADGTDNDSSDDLAYFESSEDAFGTGYTPKLEVTYQ